jgi:hypothetical protein
VASLPYKWALASFRFVRHPSLSLASVLQLLTHFCITIHNISPSCFGPSCSSFHFRFIIHFDISLSLILMTCPAHLNLTVFITTVISGGSLNNLYYSLLYRIRHNSTFSTEPKIHLSTFLSAPQSSHFSFLFKHHVSVAYNNTGPNNVLFSLIFVFLDSKLDLLSILATHNNIYLLQPIFPIIQFLYCNLTASVV